RSGTIGLFRGLPLARASSAILGKALSKVSSPLPQAFKLGIRSDKQSLFTDETAIHHPSSSDKFSADLSKILPKSSKRSILASLLYSRTAGKCIALEKP